MRVLSHSVPPDLTEKSLRHLYVAAQTILPMAQPISSHLGSRFLASATEYDSNLPKAFADTRLCQRCGTIYMPGLTCTVRTSQSRRQKRKAKERVWLTYECNICKKQFKTETVIPVANNHIVTSAPNVEGRGPDISTTALRKRKREKLQGLKSAIEKSKAKTSTVELDLLDLMRVD